MRRNLGRVTPGIGSGNLEGCLTSLPYFLPSSLAVRSSLGEVYRGLFLADGEGLDVMEGEDHRGITAAPRTESVGGTITPSELGRVRERTGAWGRADFVTCFVFPRPSLKAQIWVDDGSMVFWNLLDGVRSWTFVPIALHPHPSTA